MYKKILALTLITCCSNPISAEVIKSSQRFQSCDPQQIALDSLAAEDEQLKHLTTEAPFFTAPMKGIAIATIGVGLVVGRSIVKDEAMQNCLLHIGQTAFLMGTGYALMSALDNGFTKRDFNKQIN